MSPIIVDILNREIRIGDYTIKEPYGEDSYSEPHFALYKSSEEGGDFPISKLIAVLDKFYTDNF